MNLLLNITNQLSKIKNASTITSVKKILYVIDFYIDVKKAIVCIYIYKA